MEESISSSRTTAFYGNSYYCNYHYHHQQQQQPPAPVAAMATTTSDFEDADSGWTDYFLQLASDEEEEDASASNREKQQQLRDAGAGVPRGRGRGSASTVISKPNNKAKWDNKQAAAVKKTRIVEEEDPLQDTASSPLVQLNINDDEDLPAGSTDDWSEV